MAEDFAIDKIIPDRQLTNNSNEDIGYSNRSFNLSLHNEDIKSNYSSSSDHHKSVPNKLNGALDVPGVDNGEDSSGLITSDSNFDMAGGELTRDGDGDMVFTKKAKANPQKDISKAFKKLLTKNNQRNSTYSHNGKTNYSQDESTKFGGSPRPDPETVNSEIEGKFSKKKNRKTLPQKQY